MKLLYLGADNISCCGIYYILEKSFPQDNIVSSPIKNLQSALAKEQYDIIVLDCETASQHTELLNRELSHTSIPILALVVEFKQIKWLQSRFPSIRGMIDRDSNLERFTNTINLIIDGCFCYTWNVLNIFNTQENELNDELFDKAGLTRREREILDLCLAGQSNKAISVQLSRSEKTISAHKSNLLRKLGMKGWQLRMR